MAKNNAYPREFRERAVELYRSGGVSMDALAKQLGIASTTVANWIRQARIDDGEQPGITTSDRDERAYYSDEQSALPAPAGQETG